MEKWKANGLTPATFESLGPPGCGLRGLGEVDTDKDQDLIKGEAGTGTGARCKEHGQ